MHFRPGLPDFSCRNLPKLGKIYQNDHKIFKMITEYANAHKIYHMAIIYIKILHSKAFLNKSKLEFLV
jgi:hypothetical protein